MNAIPCGTVCENVVCRLLFSQKDVMFLVKHFTTRGDMPDHYLCLVFIALFNFSVSAVSIPQRINSTNIFNATNFKLNSGLGVCDPPLLSIDKRPTFSDCKDAIRRRLPSSPDKGTFHSGGHNDAYRLPLYEYWRSCIVTIIVGGHGSTTDVSSWLEISLAATELNEVCQVGEYTGGKIMAGATNKIWIKLSKVDISSTLDSEGSWTSVINVDKDQ